MGILLYTPPMTQLNTPYPATGVLKAFLRSQGIAAAQADGSIDWFLKIYSREGLGRVAAEIGSSRSGRLAPSVIWFARHREEIVRCVEPVVRFLQGKDPTLAFRIHRRSYLPEGPRFKAFEEAQANGLLSELSLQDAAKFMASLFIDDIADAIREGVDERFGLSRYAERIAASQPSYDPILRELESPSPGLLDRILDEEAERLYQTHRPNLLALSVPFPGNLYAGLRIARRMKQLDPKIVVAMGGGYPNTELREIRDPRFFDTVDYLLLDDGERPLLCLIEHLEGRRELRHLKRTFTRWPRSAEGSVTWCDGAPEHDIPHRESGAPTYEGLRWSEYVSLLEVPNPMHRLWSDGRWNKLTLAHGCYWSQCSFCDVTLDYIGRYDPMGADALVDRIEALIRETGETGFHFTDEAAPPALLRALAERLLARGVTISWWGNVRFEKTFTPELAELLARSGCIAVSGGLEVASDRLLKLMNKGVSVDQVARVTHALTDAGILVHAYLMYGFPTQTTEETVESLERVRQLFAAGCIQSAYWHRFSVTAHSPIGKDPARFGIQLTRVPQPTFARNDLAFEDPTPTPTELLGVGLKRALYNYMRGAGLDWDVREWFVELKGRTKKSSKTRQEPVRVPRDFVERALERRSNP